MYEQNGPTTLARGTTKKMAEAGGWLPSGKLQLSPVGATKQSNQIPTVEDKRKEGPLTRKTSHK